MQIKHGNVSATGNSARGFRNTLEDTRRDGGASGCQVGPPPALGFGAPLPEASSTVFEESSRPLVKSV